jgi:hypothetical protein
MHNFKVLRPLSIDVGEGKKDYKFGDILTIKDGVEKSIYENILRFERYRYIEYQRNIVVKGVKTEVKKEVKVEKPEIQVKTEPKKEVKIESKKRGRPKKR